MVAKTKKSKNPPIMSHEFVIQNHADIVSCVAMVFVVGLLFQATQPLASVFIAMQHNVTGNDQVPHTGETLYTSGWKDICAVFFYTLIAVVVHAVIQEYVLDKIKSKLHLSKVKLSKFNESGQLLAFYVVSALWAGDVIYREGLVPSISLLWEGYPNVPMTFMFKFFFICQLSYWIHCFPELYFQKTKREDMPAKIVMSSIYLAVVALPYIMNFTRLALCLLLLHYAAESVFHVSRILYFAEKTSAAKRGFFAWNIVFVLARLGSIILSVLTFWYGLALVEPQTLDLSTGNFNVPAVRLVSLVTVCLVQAWLLWQFINFHLRKYRERLAESPTAAKKVKTAEKKTRKPKKDEMVKKNSEEELNDLPEVDQNTKNLRSRPVPKSK